MLDRSTDTRIRAAVFEWLAEQVTVHGDVLPRETLAEGFILDGTRVPLVGPQGIFKPRVLREAPLSITTALDGPYDDAFGPDGLLRYRYRGEDPDHPDNRGLRTAKDNHLPLVYFHGVARGRDLEGSQRANVETILHMTTDKTDKSKSPSSSHQTIIQKEYDRTWERRFTISGRRPWHFRRANAPVLPMT